MRHSQRLPARRGCAPQQASAYFSMAQIASTQKRYAEAIQFVDQALIYNAHNHKARVLKAALLRLTGDLEQARAEACYQLHSLRSRSTVGMIQLQRAFTDRDRWHMIPERATQTAARLMRQSNTGIAWRGAELHRTDIGLRRCRTLSGCAGRARPVEPARLTIQWAIIRWSITSPAGSITSMAKMRDRSITFEVPRASRRIFVFRIVWKRCWRFRPLA